MHWRTIQTFENAQKAWLAKNRLEASGIPAQLLDELTSQVIYFKAGFSGIRLQVLESDYQKATNCLIEYGFLQPSSSKSTKLSAWFGAFSSRLPFIGNKAFEIRIVVVLSIIILFLVSIFILIYYYHQGY